MSFASNFSLKNPRVIPIFSQKSVDAVKTTLYYGLEKLTGYPSSYDFHEKNQFFMAIFCKKTSIF